MRTDPIRRALALVACSLLLTACVDRTILAPHANAIFVQAVLDVSVNDQYVTVETTDGATRNQRVVNGALVSLATPDGRILVAEEIHDSTIVGIGLEAPRVSTVYRFSLSKLGTSLAPGRTYRLLVVLPDGRQVSGSTTIPLFTSAPAPTPTTAFDVHRDTLSLNWSRVVGAAGYEVTISSQNGMFNVFADTAIALPGNARIGDRETFYPGLTHRVAVSAVDVNYYDYFRRNSDLFTGVGPIGHLDGALGVFGSIVPIMNRTLAVH